MNKAAEEIFDKYSERLTVAYESAGQGTVKHSNEVLTKERFLKALEEYAQQFRSQPETESKTKEEVKEIASIAWKGAANAYRMYPENKHTFTEYWAAAKSQFDKYALGSQPESKISHLFHLLNPEKEPPTEDGTYWSFSPRTCSIDKVHFHDGKFWEHHNILPCFPEFWIKGLCDVVALRSQPEKQEEKLIIDADNICPKTQKPCDDETCSPGAECNLSDLAQNPCEPEALSSQQSNTVPTEWPTRFEIADMIYDGVEKGEDPSKIAEEILSRMLSSSPSAKEEEPMQIMTSSEWLKAKAENEKEEAIGFAEWIRHNGWVGTDGYWYQQGRKMHGVTTAELFSVYQQSKTKNT